MSEGKNASWVHIPKTEVEEKWRGNKKGKQSKSHMMWWKSWNVQLYHVICFWSTDLCVGLGFNSCSSIIHWIISFILADFAWNPDPVGMHTCTECYWEAIKHFGKTAPVMEEKVRSVLGFNTIWLSESFCSLLPSLKHFCLYSLSSVELTSIVWKLNWGEKLLGYNPQFLRMFFHG